MTTTMRRLPGLLAALVLALPPGLAGAAAPASEAEPVEERQSARQFLNEAARGSLAEVTLGQMAEERARNDHVEAFAAQMIRDHSKSLAQAEQLAQQQGFAVARRMSDRHQRLAESLSNTGPEQFDRAYIEAMVEDHRRTVRRFEQQAKGQEDPITAYARQQLPVLREHLARAESILGRL